MTISAVDVKKLREETGAGMMDCKRALTEADGDLEGAKDLLRQWGLSGVAKRAGRAAREGGVFHYVHQIDPEFPAKLAVIVELNSETDFVAKTDKFKSLGANIAKHIAAMEPTWVSREDVPEDRIDRERKIVLASDAVKGKPEDVVEKIVEGKLRSIFADRGGALLDQPYVLDDSGKTTIQDLINDVAAGVKENIVVRRFARFQVGEEEG